MTIYGPYTRKDGRKHVIIIGDDGSRSTKSYPKFMLERKIGRDLHEEETADHIDDNFRNDSPENLQILSRADNIKKSFIGRERKTISITCPVCGEVAEKFLSTVKANKKKGKAGPFCGRVCAGKYSIVRNNQGVPKAFINAFK